VTSVFLFICAMGSMICAAAVVYQSRIIVRIMREQSLLIVAINSLMIEAVWPPHNIEGE